MTPMPRSRNSFGSLLARAILGMALVVTAASAPAQTLDPALKALIDGPQRSEKNRARDVYRHPAEVLSFFGVKPDSVVVEILPGAGGYWTEILAPYLKAKGRYIAANAEAASTSEEARKDNAGFKAKLAADPAYYDKVEITEFAADRHEIAPPGSADFVLTFRNLHNWMARDETDAALKTFYAALKPGGVLGIVDHRGPDNQPRDPVAKSGYVRQDVAIQMIEAVGFKFAGSSEANANPKDTKDYSVGVWALPPTYRLKDQDRDKYASIGESDRFTLKFVKPAP
jgi:predicted methyltransferase